MCQKRVPFVRPLTLGVMAIVLGGIGWLSLNRPSVPSPVTRKVVAPPSPASRIVVEPADLDMGELRRGTDEPPKARFTIRSVGDGPLFVTSIVGSCGCGEIDFSNPRIEPGDTRLVSFRLRRLGAAGPHRNTVTVHSTDSVRPVVRVVAKWTTVEPYALEERELLLAADESGVLRGRAHVIAVRTSSANPPIGAPNVVHVRSHPFELRAVCENIPLEKRERGRMAVVTVEASGDGLPDQGEGEVEIALGGEHSPLRLRVEWDRGLPFVTEPRQVFVGVVETSATPSKEIKLAMKPTWTLKTLEGSLEGVSGRVDIARREGSAAVAMANVTLSPPFSQGTLSAKLVLRVVAEDAAGMTKSFNYTLPVLGLVRKAES